MIQWTTPTFTLRMPATINMDLVKNLYFTLSQGEVILDKRGESIVRDGNMLYVYCSQEDTGRFSEGLCEMQLNWTYENGRRMASKKKTIRVDDNLLDEVVV